MNTTRRASRPPALETIRENNVRIRRNIRKITRRRYANKPVSFRVLKESCTSTSTSTSTRRLQAIAKKLGLC